MKKIEELNELVLGGFAPDLTFILDIAPEEGLSRSERRLAAEQFDHAQTEDKFERLDVEIHEAIRNGFLEIAKNEPDRCHVIDATQSVEDMAETIRSIAVEKL